MALDAPPAPEPPASPTAPPERVRPYSEMLAILAGGMAIALLVAVIALVNQSDDGGGGGGGGNVAVTLTEFAIEGNLTAEPGAVGFDVTNAGSQVHDLQIEGTEYATAELPAGGSERLEAELAEGSYTVFCSISGHREAGMEATLTVGGGGEAAAGGGHAEMTEMDYAEMDRAMEESILQFPAETEGKGNQPLEPTVGADGVKEFDLTAEIIDWEVEPGITVKAWAYNGQVPGPLLQADVGDRIRVNFTNNLPMGSDIHFHGFENPNEMDGVAPLTQPLVMPGETFVYEFTVDHPEIGMYHAHHHGQMQVPNGLFGAFIVGENPMPTGRTISGITIPDQVDPVLELPMVLNDAGVIGLTLNGKGFPATEPIVVNQGDWVVVHYYNEGLQSHPMHLHGFDQLVYARDGVPLDNPYWVDTLNVAPGERFSVMFQATSPGTWVYHCHILNHVERETGMFGMVTAVVVQ